MEMGRFGAVLTAMVTPFDDQGALDCDVAASLARWLVERGSEGLVVAGTTGESPVLSEREKLDLFTAVRAAVTVPLIAGTTTNDTAHSVELTKEAEKLGVDGILAVTPFYNRPSQAGLVAHFTAVAEATQLPVMLYDIPFRTGRKIETATLLQLARDVPNIVAVKDAAGSVGESARLIAAAPSGFELYSGEDAMTLALLAVGAVGEVSVNAHWTGELHSEMVTAFGKGDVLTARAVNARLLESHAFESSDAAPNPVPTKAMMRVLGHKVGQCRLPMGPAPEGLEDRAREVLANLG
jgi:4-hydroxy-tetrahydrodipicolinate synthase